MVVRRAVGLALLAVLPVVGGACSSSTPDLESIGLAVETGIQAGTTLELGFPVATDTTVRVASAPAGITASVVTSDGQGLNILRVDVDADTPRGSYNLGLGVVQDGTETVVSWPFEVVDGDESPIAIAERLRTAVNNRDAESVAEMAPNTPADTLDFFIGGGPFESVECYVFEGKDECHLVNGIADFVFNVDMGSGLVTEITYVGGN